MSETEVVRTAMVVGSHVLNVVMAPRGLQFEGYEVIELPEGSPVSRGWYWDGAAFSPQNLDVEGLRTLALATLAQKRWEIETGGILFNGDIPIRTDEVGQAKITGALTLMDKDPTLTSVDWEGQPGMWATIDKPTLEAIGIAVGRHIQACFSRARQVSEAIQLAADQQALEHAAAAIEDGWPV